jgi:hypothetical protein
MDIIYYIAGLVVLSVVGRLLKRKTGAGTPPRRIHLFPATAAGKHAKDLIARKKDLDACGLKRLGTYRVDPMNVVCTAFANDAESICAVVYHHNAVGAFTDVVSQNTLGRTFTATSAPQGGTLDQREGHDKVFDASLTIPEMFELVKERRPEGPWQAWNRANFAEKFEAAYAGEMDWRAGRGGVTREEVRRTAVATGKNYSEETITKATEQLQNEYAETRQSD